MDFAFLVVVAVGLIFISIMTAARMTAAGVSSRHIRRLVVEIWLAFLIWMAAFYAIGVIVGIPVREDGMGELRELAERFHDLQMTGKLIVALVAAGAIVIAVRLWWRLRVAMGGREREER